MTEQEQRAVRELSCARAKALSRHTAQKMVEEREGFLDEALIPIVRRAAQELRAQGKIALGIGFADDVAASIRSPYITAEDVRRVQYQLEAQGVISHSNASPPRPQNESELVPA